MLDIFYGSYDLFAKDCGVCGLNPVELIDNGEYVILDNGGIVAVDYLGNVDFVKED